ncbi:glycosyltransferase family 32 protein [Candidatus Mycoplasma mahonii]|uniref:glycosyltransferase family 32 protein n=1 Tax=Candidatus Mycoplasma mahonii TaxID=3004105 RepID=UPI0026EB9748|nr:glycosyltransferase [Candidatus Mycoplasma mahonii]WKX02682.1 glycosyltransferase [Candidatus Mycoplasma mahonii]
MINKIIHYIWVGDTPMNETVKGYVAQWKKVLGSEWKFMFWNEQNLDIDKYPFTKYHYQRKNWAFISDYMRVYVVNKHGGFYLDVDVELKKTLNPYVKYDGVFSRLLAINLTASTFGGKANDPIFKRYLEIYENEWIIKNQPKIISADILAFVLREKMAWPDNWDTFIKNNYIILDEKFLQVDIDAESVAIHKHHMNWKNKNAYPKSSKFYYYKQSSYRDPEVKNKMIKYVSDRRKYITQLIIEKKEKPY